MFTVLGKQHADLNCSDFSSKQTRKKKSLTAMEIKHSEKRGNLLMSKIKIPKISCYGNNFTGQVSQF